MGQKRKKTIKVEQVPLPPADSVPVKDTLYTAGPKKKLRVETTQVYARNPSLEIPASAQAPAPVPTAPSPTKPRSLAHKKTSDLLRDLQKCTSVLLRVLCLESDARVDGTCTSCGTGAAIYRCEECHLSPILCDKCIVSRHSNNPLHHIVKRVHSTHLDGWYFKSTELGSLGLVIHLGHNGSPFPNTLGSSVKNMVIVDCNGMHRCKLLACQCQDAGSLIHQLVISRFFPATTEHIQTLFTHHLLRQFCQHTHKSGATAYAYFAALCRLTNDTFKDQVDDRYRKFLRVTRMWRHLEDLKRSGQAFKIDKHLPPFHFQSFAILCPACPQLGINMAKGWETECLMKRHKHQSSVVLDGNFRATNKNKPHDPDEPCLSNGRAYFVADKPYRDYLGTVKDDSELSTCTGFKAGDIMRQSHNKGLLVTGVVGLSCSRHSIVRPKAFVDLFHGERSLFRFRYSNVDYCVGSTLQAYEHSKLPIEIDYNIVCKYQVNLESRMKTRFPTLVGLIDHVSYFIPGMHIKAHNESCQKRFTRDYFPYTGKCDCEGSERVWSELNQWSTSTTEMTPAHRHDVLNDNIGDWNLHKVFSMNTYLVDHLILATDERLRYHREFEDLTASTPSDLVAKWKQLPTSPQISEDGKTVHSVYMPDAKKVPTQAQIQLAILAEEEKALGSESVPTGRADLMQSLMFGLDLKQLQVNTLQQVHVHAASPTPSAELVLRRLRTKLGIWADLQAKVMPTVGSIYPNDLADPENTPLNLPSQFKLEEHLRLKLLEAQQLERCLREGQAHDALKDLKQAISMKLANINARRIHITGQRGATRAANVINAQVDIITKHTETYHRVRAALITLGMPEGSLEFQVLQPEDCTAKRMFTDQNLKPNRKERDTETTKELSWIWRIGHRVANAKESSKWDIESKRVHWFLSRAQKDRWIEEVEILEEEMRRVVRFFTFYEKVWVDLAAELDSEPGERAYALKTAAMYQEVADDARNRFPDHVLAELST